jgi:hypothetical protein
MSGLKNTGQKFINASTGKGFKTNEQLRRPKRAAERDARYAAAEMPDEELIRRNERRKAAARRGSRVRNVLTSDEDMLG